MTPASDVSLGRKSSSLPKAGKLLEVEPRPTPASTDAVRTSVETRLRSIVETQPVCLAEIANDGKVLAMNAAGLVMVGAQDLAQVLGTDFFRLAASEDRSRVVALIKRVCDGNDGALEYAFVGLDGVRRSVETRAVPLARGPEGGFSALAVTLDLTQGSSRNAGRHELQEWTALRDRLTQAPEAAADERHRLDQRGDELEQALREAQTRQETQAQEWAAERDELKAAVHAAEAGREGAAEEWAGERDRLTQAAEAADDERHRLDQRGGELEQALREAQTRQETQAQEWAAERDELKAAVHAAEAGREGAAEEWAGERDRLT